MYEMIKSIDINSLVPFEDHPFKERNGIEQEELLESIKENGLLGPITVRPLPDGKYEIISGHRRVEACKSLGISEISATIKEMSKDEAIVAMVDSNIHREHLLPSEKAFAYKMKLEAMKHQGKRTSRQLVGKQESAERISETESGRQVQRYIRLTCLIPELLEEVDKGNMAFSPAVELSFLTNMEQQYLLDAMKLNDCAPSHSQSIRLKKLSQEGVLVKDTIYDILSEEKPNQKEQIKLNRSEWNKYFPESYTNEQIKKDIEKGLVLLKKQRERNARSVR